MGGYEWPAYGMPICLTWQAADGTEKQEFYRCPIQSLMAQYIIAEFLKCYDPYGALCSFRCSVNNVM